MARLEQKIAAGEFKAKCLKIMEDVYKKHTSVTITKRGIPIAKLVPIEEKNTIDLFGSQRNALTIIGDIISPIDSKWEANE